MKTQQELDKWIEACQRFFVSTKFNEQHRKWMTGCIKYYDKQFQKSINMKSNEERIQQLEQAHSRLYNSFNTFHQDYLQHRLVYQEQFDLLKQMINSLQPKENEVDELPDTMKAGTDYRAVISTIMKATPVKWQNMDYCNWELKLQGKDDYVYVAFIPQSVQLQVGDKVRFTYAHPFQLKKLKQI